jgi:acetyl-CoA carboxylase biotin carboxyl carrier protein
VSTPVSPVSSPHHREGPSPATGAPGVPIDVIRQLVSAAHQNSVRRLVVRTADVEVEIERDPQPVTGEGLSPVTGEDVGSHLVDVVAPAVGVVRLAPDDGAPGAVVGAAVGPEDQVARIEAMKMTTAVRAAHAGIIREVCVRDGDVVEFEQPLLRLETTEEQVPGAGR